MRMVPALIILGFFTPISHHIHDNPDLLFLWTVLYTPLTLLHLGPGGPMAALGLILMVILSPAGALVIGSAIIVAQYDERERIRHMVVDAAAAPSIPPDQAMTITLPVQTTDRWGKLKQDAWESYDRTSR